jgi:hypothetical protein
MYAVLYRDGLRPVCRFASSYLDAITLVVLLARCGIRAHFHRA